MLLPKQKQGTVSPEYLFKSDVEAPVKAGDQVGEVRYLSGEEVISSAPLTVSESVERVGYFDVLSGIIKSLFLK